MSGGGGGLLIIDVLVGLFIITSCQTSCDQDVKISRDGMGIFLQCGWYGEQWCKEHTQPKGK